MKLNATIQLLSLSMLGLGLAACGGGGGGGVNPGTNPGPGPGPGPGRGTSNTGDPIFDTLTNLGVPVNDNARVDDQNNELDEDYSPLGGRPTLDGKFELMMFGANHAGDDYGRILNVWEDFTTLPEGNIHSHPVLASYADDAPWLWDTVSASQQSGAPQQRRHGCAGDLDGNGLDEVLLVHVENDNLLIDVVWDEEHGYAKEQYDVDGSSAVREIAIAAGDYDGDGACEIAVMMETADSGVLRMYDFVNGAFAHDHTVSLERTLAGSRMFVTMEFGNVDNDYRSEFAMVVNEHTPSQSTSHFRVLDDAEAGWSELIAGVSGSPDVASNDGYTVADLALGDIDGDGRDELVIAGIGATDGSCSTGLHFMVALDDRAHDFELLGEHSAIIGSTLCSSTPHDLAIRYVHVNIGDIDGDTYDEIQVAHKVYEDFATFGPFTEGWELPTFTTYNGLGNTQLFDRSTSAVVMADVTGNGKANIVTLNEFPQNSWNRGARIWGLEQPGEDPPLENVQTIGVNSFGSTHQNIVLVAPNCDIDSPILQYDAGEYELIYTEPIVIAVIAAPPTQTAIPQNLEASSTSFGNTTSNSTAEERSATVSGSASVGASFDGGVITQSETSIKASFTNETTVMTGHAYELSRTVIFESAYNEDKVVLTTIPVDTYTYTILSHPEPEMVGEKLVLRLPRSPITFQAERDYYNENIYDGGILIDESIFNHTIGDLSTYPTAAQKDLIMNTVGGLQEGPQAVGVGYAAETRELSVGESWSEGQELAMGYTFEAEATAGGVLVGFSVGASSSDSVTMTSGQETTYTARVGDLDPDFFVPGLHQYSFGIFSYVHTDPATGRQIEVINYWVE